MSLPIAILKFFNPPTDMAIEIRELVIKVKIEESVQGTSERLDIEKIKQLILKECKKEIKRELNRKKER
ncbi:MAG: hypothetical protein CMD31_04475 [Flavobacteriales bacterium]|nr:hypothetical protein [Flavobacteriales bacterium]